MNVMSKSVQSPEVAGARGRKRFGKQAQAACNRCRHSKKRCNGARPSCEQCLRASVTCLYDTVDVNETRSQAIKRQHTDLQSSLQSVNDSLTWLRLQTPELVLSCLKRLGDAPDPGSELCSIVSAERAQRLFPQPSSIDVLIAASPLLHTPADVELSVSYPNAYPLVTGVPPKPVHLGQAAIGASRGQPITQPFHLLTSAQSNAVPNFAGAGSQHNAKTLCDIRLYALKIGFWTTVPISDELAATIFSTYLEVEHPVYGFFDANLFIQDLVAREVDFCSPLLVNAILFWSCSTFGTTIPAAAGFAQSFLSSSQVLLEADRNSVSPLSVAALMIMAIGTICCGDDQLAKSYMAAGVSMAEALHLIGEDRYKPSEFNHLSQDEMSVNVATAWGCFNFITVYTMHFHDLYSGTFTKCPPLLMPPGSKASSATSSDAENFCSTPLHLGVSFPFFCEFWRVAHRIAAVYFASPEAIHQRVPLAFAEDQYRGLLRWAESLPSELTNPAIMVHNVSEMLICYHATIMDLFRPFLNQGSLLSTFSADPCRPETIFSLSFRHLRRLTLGYDPCFAGHAESHTISWVHGPLYVASATLQYNTGADQQAGFISSMRTFSSLIQCHGVVESFVKGLLAMATDSRTLTPSEAIALYHNLISKRRHDHFHISKPETEVILDQNLALLDRSAANGKSLTKKYEAMSAPADFLTPTWAEIDS